MRSLTFILMLGTAAATLPGCARTPAPPVLAQARCCLTYTARGGTEHKVQGELPGGTSGLCLYTKTEHPATLVVVAFEGPRRALSRSIAARVEALSPDSVQELRWTPEPTLQTTMFVTLLGARAQRADELRQLVKRTESDPAGPACRELYAELTDLYGEKGFGMVQRGKQPINSGASQTLTARSANPSGEPEKASGARALRDQTTTHPVPGSVLPPAPPFDWLAAADPVTYPNEGAAVEYVISSSH